MRWKDTYSWRKLIAVPEGEGQEQSLSGDGRERVALRDEDLDGIDPERSRREGC